MADLKNLETLINQAVEEVLQKALPDLRQNLVQQVLQALEPQLTAEVTPPAPSLDSETLNDCVAAIQKGTTQVEILDALIEAASNFAARTALFVVRGTNAVGWRARGFSDNDAVRSTPLELSSGLAGKATQSHGPVTGPSSEFTAEFPDKFGASAQDAWMLPLLVRDKAVALIYADGGTDGQLLDAAALQCLVRVTGLWLEVFATRKATGGATTVTAPSSVRDSALPERRAMAAAAVPAPATHAPEPVPQPEPPKSARVIVKPPVPEPVPHPVPAVAPVPSGEEGEVHKKARRFAKLLVDEIKLYNQAKVTEGKQHRDLYDRLREDIEKSRASYDKRYGNTVAKDGDYFNQELIRILADNDTGLLGNNFPR